jgi:hypothetical protein
MIISIAFAYVYLHPHKATTDIWHPFVKRLAGLNLVFIFYIKYIIIVI